MEEAREHKKRKVGMSGVRGLCDACNSQRVPLQWCESTVFLVLGKIKSLGKH
jgi:hypothetical protein